MICKVRNSILKYGFPVSGRTVYAAVSGGADSMALLYALNELKAEFSMNICVCHVNHGIRGESADADEGFVRSQCEKLGVPFEVLHADVPKIAEERGLGLEECGRQVRYEFFSSLGDDVLIATAHTLSDRCETLLFNITRGTSVRGLCSIPAQRGNIIRPLIDCTRAEIEAYCAEKNIEYITDETNYDDTYSRNRIRLNVIPELKRINPSFEQSAYRLIQSAAEDAEFFDSLTENIVSEIKCEKGYDAGRFGSLSSAIRKRVVSRIVADETGIIPENIHINQIEYILDGGKTEIIGDNFVEVKNGILCINAENDVFSEWETDFTGFSASTPNGRLYGKIVNKNELPRQQFVHNNVLDCDCIVGKCIVRNRRAGDKMRRAGSSCTKTLKKLFTELHTENRNSVPILADEEGILWVKGIGCADRCKITKETDKILLLGEDCND